MLSLLRRKRTPSFLPNLPNLGIVSRLQSALPIPAVTVGTGEKDDNYPEAVWKWLSSQPRLQQLGIFRGLQRQDVYVASAPGRVDVMGGFADFNGSHVLQYPTSERTVAVAMVHRGSCIGTDKVPILQLISLQVPSLGVITEFRSSTSSKMTKAAPQVQRLPMSLLQSPVTGNVTDSTTTVRDGLRGSLGNRTSGEGDNWPYYVTVCLPPSHPVDKLTLTPSGDLLLYH